MSEARRAQPQETLRRYAADAGHRRPGGDLRGWFRKSQTPAATRTNSRAGAPTTKSATTSLDSVSGHQGARSHGECMSMAPSAREGRERLPREVGPGASSKGGRHNEAGSGGGPSRPALVGRPRRPAQEGRRCWPGPWRWLGYRCLLLDGGRRKTGAGAAATWFSGGVMAARPALASWQGAPAEARGLRERAVRLRFALPPCVLSAARSLRFVPLVAMRGSRRPEDSA